MEFIVYKLHCNLTNEDYYGSSENYKQRIGTHKTSTEKQLSKRQCMSRQIIDRNDYQFSIMEVCENKLQMKQRERFYFENYPCINKIIPFRTKEEVNEIKRLYSKTHQRKPKT